jgi:hypothetical protein
MDDLYFPRRSRPRAGNPACDWDRIRSELGRSHPLRDARHAPRNCQDRPPRRRAIATRLADRYGHGAAPSGHPGLVRRDGERGPGET